MYSNLVFNTDKELSVSLIKETLQRSLISEPVNSNSSYVQINEIWKWAEFIGFNKKKERDLCVEGKQNKKKKPLSQHEHQSLSRTEHESSVEVWTKSYLKSIGSSGVIHSIKTGKHVGFIMCNIRDMNICRESHEDYFNDDTVYVNLKEKQFSVRCNHIPCNKRSWV
jgi:hypothetical protein